MNLKSRILQHRVSLAVTGTALIVLILSMGLVLQNAATINQLEVNLFRFINHWPDWLDGFFTLITNAGTIGAIVVAAGIALIKHRRRIGLAILLAGGAAWAITDVMKDLLGRGRPASFFDDAIIRYDLINLNNGYPSGHSAIAAAVAMSLSMIVPRKWAPLLIVGAFLVGLSRIYLGVHLPIDVVGGWAVGIIIGYGTDLFLMVERQKAKEPADG